MMVSVVVGEGDEDWFGDFFFVGDVYVKSFCVVLLCYCCGYVFCEEDFFVWGVVGSEVCCDVFFIGDEVYVYVVV